MSRVAAGLSIQWAVKLVAWETAAIRVGKPSNSYIISCIAHCGSQTHSIPHLSGVQTAVPNPIWARRIQVTLIYCKCLPVCLEALPLRKGRQLQHSNEAYRPWVDLGSASNRYGALTRLNITFLIDTASCSAPARPARAYQLVHRRSAHTAVACLHTAGACLHLTALSLTSRGLFILFTQASPSSHLKSHQAGPKAVKSEVSCAAVLQYSIQQQCN